MHEPRPMPTTETRNPETVDIDQGSTLELVRLINAEDEIGRAHV